MLTLLRAAFDLEPPFCNTWFVTKPKRPYHHGDLRSALLRAAEAALQGGAGDDLSLRELSRGLGVSNTAPRRHFPSKQALLNALAVDGFERLAGALNRAAADAEPGFDAQLTTLARAYVRWALKHSALIRLMFAAKHQSNPPGELLEASQAALSTVPSMILAGQAAGVAVAGDPYRLSLPIMAAAEGLIAISDHGKFHGIPVERLVGEVVQQIIVGLRPRSS